MKHIKLFEAFNGKIEVAEAGDGTLMFKAYDQSFATVHWDSDRNISSDNKEYFKKSQAKMRQILLDTFPASSVWKDEVSKMEMSEDEDIDIIPAAAKVRNYKGDIGPVQLWDEGKMTYSVSIGSPFSDQRHTNSGLSLADIRFNDGVDPKLANMFGKELERIFPGRSKDDPNRSGSRIVAN